MEESQSPELFGHKFEVDSRKIPIEATGLGKHYLAELKIDQDQINQMVGKALRSVGQTFNLREDDIPINRIKILTNKEYLEEFEDKSAFLAIKDNLKSKIKQIPKSIRNMGLMAYDSLNQEMFIVTDNILKSFVGRSIGEEQYIGHVQFMIAHELGHAASDVYSGEEIENQNTMLNRRVYKVLNELPALAAQFDFDLEAKGLSSHIEKSKKTNLNIQFIKNLVLNLENFQESRYSINTIFNSENVIFAKWLLKTKGKEKLSKLTKTKEDQTIDGAFEENYSKNLSQIIDEFSLEILSPEHLEMSRWLADQEKHWLNAQGSHKTKSARLTSFFSRFVVLPEDEIPKDTIRNEGLMINIFQTEVGKLFVILDPISKKVKSYEQVSLEGGPYELKLALSYDSLEGFVESQI